MEVTQMPIEWWAETQNTACVHSGTPCVQCAWTASAVERREVQTHATWVSLEGEEPVTKGSVFEIPFCGAPRTGRPTDTESWGEGWCRHSGIRQWQWLCSFAAQSRLSVTPWGSARRAPLPVTVCQNLLRLVSIELVMPSSVTFQLYKCTKNHWIVHFRRMTVTLCVSALCRHTVYTRAFVDRGHDNTRWWYSQSQTIWSGSWLYCLQQLTHPLRASGFSAVKWEW